MAISQLSLPELCLQHTALPSYSISVAAQAPWVDCDSLAVTDAAADGCPLCLHPQPAPSTRL